MVTQLTVKETSLLHPFAWTVLNRFPSPMWLGINQLSLLQSTESNPSLPEPSSQTHLNSVGSSHLGNPLAKVTCKINHHSDLG